MLSAIGFRVQKKHHIRCGKNRNTIKVDDLERVKRYAGAEQIDTIIRKVKEQERTEQQIRRYDKSYGTR